MSNNKIYVGNLSYNTTEEELKSHFAKYGKISSINLIIDRDTGRSKGFGFIEFDNDKTAQESLQEDGKEFMERKLRVNIANNKPNNSRRF